MGEWVGRPGEQVRPWSALGRKLARGNWKSVALAASFFEQSPALLHALPLDAVRDLVEIIDRLSERSYQLAASCLERSGELFADLAPQEPAALPRVRRRGREGLVGRYPALLRARPRAAGAGRAGRARRLPAPRRRRRRPDRTPGLPALRRGRRGARRGPAHVPRHSARALPRGSPRGSPAAAMAFLRSSPHVLTRLTADQLERWLQTGWDLPLRAGQRGRRRGLLPTRIGARRG